MTTNGDATAIGSAVNEDGNETIQAGMPYTVAVTIRGTAPLLFHRYSPEDVKAKKDAPKGSDTKNTDVPENYVYRDEDGIISLPGIYLRNTLTDQKNGAAKYHQDPRSPRKSALDLYRAGVVPLTIHAPITTVTKIPAETWDYLDVQRVTVQRNAISRTRPAFLAGWEATVQLQVLTPEYISPDKLLELLGQAGRLVGVGDFRPTYGRFQVIRYDIGLE